MAALRGVMEYDHHARRISRLAHKNLSARLSTWQTHVNVDINRFGQVSVSIERNGSIVKKMKYDKGELSKKEIALTLAHEQRVERRRLGKPSGDEIDNELERFRDALLPRC